MVLRGLALSGRPEAWGRLTDVGTGLVRLPDGGRDLAAGAGPLRDLEQGGVGVGLERVQDLHPRPEGGADRLDAWIGDVIESPACPPAGGCATRVLLEMRDVAEVVASALDRQR